CMPARVEADDPVAVTQRARLGQEVACAPAEAVAQHDDRAVALDLDVQRRLSAHPSATLPWFPWPRACARVPRGGGHAMIKLYGVPRSRTMRPLWMLEELGLPYENVKVSFVNETRVPGFLKINPNGHIPVLQGGGVEVRV